MKTSLLITCEHGGNKIPLQFKKQIPFSALPIFATHRGWDIGVLGLAKKLASLTDGKFFYSETSRLLIDLNRSLNSQTIFSEFSENLSSGDRKILIENFYLPYRRQIREFAAEQIRANASVLHLSVHSFTPIWKSRRRPTEIGLLFDPNRKPEAEFAHQWIKNLKSQSRFVIHANRPYQGIGDGQTTELRKAFKSKNYSGIEVEVNQKFLQGARKSRNVSKLSKLLFATLPNIN